MKVTRRKLATVLAPAILAARVPPLAAQTSAVPPASDAALDAARARMKQNGETLARQTVPMDTEPAFQFRV